MQEQDGSKQQEATQPPSSADLKANYKSLGIDALKGATTVARTKPAEAPKRVLERETD